MTLTEYIITNMPQVDIVEFLNKAELFSTEFLFCWAPIIGCILICFKGLQFVFRAIRLLLMTREGKYYKGTVVSKHMEEGDFYETGRWFFIRYPVVQYKHRGQLYTCIANRPARVKIGEKLSVYVCADGDEHLSAPGILTLLWGVALIGLGIIGNSYVYNTFNIFM